MKLNSCTSSLLHCYLLLCGISLLVAAVVPVGVVAATANDADQTCGAATGGGSPENNGECRNPEAVVDVDETKKNKKNKYPECGLYLAASTIPGAGLGIFNGPSPKKTYDAVGSGDVCLGAIDVKKHQGEHVFNPFKAYYWSGQTMGMTRESASTDIEAYCPGLDCAINCNLALINTFRSWPLYDYAKLHRSKDPGAGAITPYHNGTTVAARDIPAGAELFKSYGASYFSSRYV